MIDHDKGLIRLGKQEDVIARFDIWWLTPFGVEVNYEDAKLLLKNNGMPLSILRPVTVAVGQKGLYEQL